MCEVFIPHFKMCEVFNEHSEMREVFIPYTGSQDILCDVFKLFRTLDGYIFCVRHLCCTLDHSTFILYTGSPDV